MPMQPRPMAETSRPCVPSLRRSITAPSMSSFGASPLLDGCTRDRFASVADVTHRNLGRTGVNVSPLCLGAMMFGEWGNADHDESIRIIHRALDAGINFIDASDVYSRAQPEEIAAEALTGSW